MFRFNKRLLIFLSLLIILISSCNENEVSKNIIILKDLALNKNKAYLIFRGTNSKEGNIAIEFNINNKVVSHVGILTSWGHNNWLVTHVLDFKDDSADFRNQSLNMFCSSYEDVKYISIWEINSFNSIKVKLLQDYINTLFLENIVFDKSFNLDNSSKLYCSELIVNLLSKTYPKTFNFKTRRKKLSGIYKSYFKKDSLEYFPVDMFFYDKRFKKVFEHYTK